MRKIKITMAVLLLNALSTLLAKDILVVSSIYPYQQIANAVLLKPSELVVDSFISPHHYQLKPSDAKKIREADIFIWGGAVMTPQLSRIVNSRDAGKITIDVSQLDNIHLITLDKEHAHEHNHSHADDDHHYDPHLWLSPNNATLIAATIKDKISALDASNGDQYQIRFNQFNQQLTETVKSIKVQLAPYQTKQYYVFHDAYRYFEQAFSIKSAGVIKTDPSKLERSGALLKLKQQMKAGAEKGESCLFIEPQFRTTLAERLATADIKIGVLDPIGYQQNQAHPLQGYTDILENLSLSFIQCFAAS